MKKIKLYLEIMAVGSVMLVGCGKNLNQRETTSVFGTEPEYVETLSDATESDIADDTNTILDEHPGAVDTYEIYSKGFGEAPKGKENITLDDVSKANDPSKILSENTGVMARNIYYTNGVEETCAYVYVGKNDQGEYTQVFTSDFDSGCALDSKNEVWYVFDGSSDYSIIYPIQEDYDSVIETGEKQALFLGDFEDATIKGVYSKDGYTCLLTEFSVGESETLKVCIILNDDDTILEYRAFLESGEQVMWASINKDVEYPHLEFMEYIGNPEIERRKVDIYYMGVDGGSSKTFYVPTGYAVSVMTDGKTIYTDSLCTSIWETESSDNVSGADLYKDLTLYIK